MQRLAQRLMGVLTACLLFAGSPALAQEAVRIGVLAFRPKPQTLVQWQPLATVLKQAIPTREFVIEALAYPELEQAVASRQVDFVLTNPGHFVLLQRRNALSAPLATLAVDESGHKTTAFGGVVFTLAGRSELNTLTDLRGKRVAAVTAESLGGFQMQAYELARVDIRIPENLSLLITGLPHDKVVDAVLAGQADAGFVRSGVIEAMVREGRLDHGRIKIINRQSLAGFPVAVSTRLYPEWPLAAMPHVDEALARRVAAEVFLLDRNEAVTKALKIGGFVVPADYGPVEELLRELRLPPFEMAPRFRLQDIWARYQMPLTLIAILGGLVAVLSVHLLLARRRLATQHALVLGQKQQLEASEAKLSAILESMDSCIYLKDGTGRYLYANRRMADFLGTTADAITGQADEAFFDEATAARLRSSDRRVFDQGETVRGEEGIYSRAENRLRVFQTVKIPLRDTRGEIYALCGVSTDISEHKAMADRVRHMAFFDSLTDLPNRRLLSDRIGQAMAGGERNHEYGALIFLDLDHFKGLNDTLGHAVGDLLLVEVARRLRGCVREIDTVARFGGDEFVVLLSALSPDLALATSQAEVIAGKVRDALADPYFLSVETPAGQVERITHRGSASIGVVVFLGSGTAEDELMRQADLAMYQAKDAGRNVVRFYQPAN